MGLPPFLNSIIGWLRDGYPEGVPVNDYVPLFALLRRQLSDAEVAAVAEEIISGEPDPNTRVAIKVAISKVTNELPLDDDVARVRSRLISAGYPFPSRASD